jgi:hypothetical protein
LEFGEQVTGVTESGVKVRFDFVARDPKTGAIRCIECKASDTAPLTPNQARAFPEIGLTGVTIAGAGKPVTPGGTKIPPLTVELIRNPKR